MTVAQPTSIEPVTRENWRSTLPLEVAPDQQRFVAHYSPISLVILAKAHVGALGKHWVPLLIRRDGEPAGMVAVAYDESDPAAERFAEIDGSEVIARGLKVMDLTAFTLCGESKKPIVVFNMNTQGNLVRVLKGESVGTVVHWNSAA